MQPPLLLVRRAGDIPNATPKTLRSTTIPQQHYDQANPCVDTFPTSVFGFFLHPFLGFLQFLEFELFTVPAPFRPSCSHRHV